MEKLLLQEGFTRVWLSSWISLYYQGHIWDLHWYGEKQFFNEEFFWIESLYPLQEFLKDFHKHDADISIIAVDHVMNEAIIYATPIWTHSLYINDQNLVSPSINSLINENSVLDYQYLGLIRKFGYNQNDLTPWKNIKRLLPWFIYRWNVNRFYDEMVKTRITKKINVWFMLPLYLDESIVNRLSSIDDKVIWVLLSWGLDSSIIAAKLLQFNEHLSKPKKIRFFTTENAEDLTYAKEVAKFLKIKLEIIPNDDVEVMASEIFEANETPIDLGSVVPNIKLFKRISSMWIHTVFTWDGPDELFRWYRRNAEDFDYHMHDINNELVYYHFPRLEKAARYYNIDLVTPYITPDIWNLAQDFKINIYKNDLKNLAHWLIPESVIDRIKEPLKNKQIREDKIAYQHKFLNDFIQYSLQKWESIQTTKK